MFVVTIRWNGTITNGVSRHRCLALMRRLPGHLRLGSEVTIHVCVTRVFELQVKPNTAVYPKKMPVGALMSICPCQIELEMSRCPFQLVQFNKQRCLLLCGDSAQCRQSGCGILIVLMLSRSNFQRQRTQSGYPLTCLVQSRCG